MNLCFTETIEDYPGYLICRDGRVLSLARKTKRTGNKTHKGINHLTIPGKILKSLLDKSNGYYSVRLSRNGKTKKLYIHTLLGKAFIPNPENKRCINHINGDKTDNRLSNLEWVTHWENNDHSLNVLKKNVKDKSVVQMANGKTIKIFPKLKDVKKDGFSISPIGQRCRGNIKGSYRGFNWVFK